MFYFQFHVIFWTYVKLSVDVGQVGDTIDISKENIMSCKIERFQSHS